MLVPDDRRARRRRNGSTRLGGGRRTLVRRGRAPARRARDGRAAALEPLVREHRPRQRLHDLQPDPRGRGCADARVRDVAGRALPRDPRRELDDRDHAGGAGEACARPPRRARRAHRERRAGRRAARTCRARRWSSATSSAWSPATSSSPTVGSWRARGSRSTSRSSPASPTPSRARAGDELRSGSFVVEGTGALHGRPRWATASYAEKVDRARPGASVIRARRSSGRSTGCCTRSLRRWCRSDSSSGTRSGSARRRPVEAVTTAVAAVVTLVPEGLILLVSLTFAVAAVRMARRGALTQQLNALESLASVDVVCLDKTGTLTEADLRVTEVVPVAEQASRLASALGDLAASASAQNTTLDAIAAAVPGREQAPGAGGALLLPAALERRPLRRRLVRARRAGAPAARRPRGPAPSRRRVRADACSPSRGRRRPSRTGTPPCRPGSSGSGSSCSPSGCARRGETVEFFHSQGVELKVLSGDAPETVARDRAPTSASRSTAARWTAALCPPTGPSCGRSLRERASSGESRPRTSAGRRGAPRRRPLRRDGRRRRQRRPRAQGRAARDRAGQRRPDGAQRRRPRARARATSRSCRRWSGEGRRILRNLQRVAKLFVTKSAFAAFLDPLGRHHADRVPAAPAPPHARARRSTIGIPAFFLALAPSAGPFRLGGLPARGLRGSPSPPGPPSGSASFRATCLALKSSTCRSSRRARSRRRCWSSSACT